MLLGKKVPEEPKSVMETKLMHSFLDSFPLVLDSKQILCVIKPVVNTVITVARDIATS